VRSECVIKVVFSFTSVVYILMREAATTHFVCQSLLPNPSFINDAEHVLQGLLLLCLPPFCFSTLKACGIPLVPLGFLLKL